MLDARCLFKKKVGLTSQSSESEDDADIDDGESVEEEKQDKAESKNLKSNATKQVLKQFDRINIRPEQVMWEPTEGKLYAVLFTRLIEIYSVEADEPLHTLTFDTSQTSFTFLGSSQIVCADDRGRMTVFRGVDKTDGEVEMRLIKTSAKRLKSLQASPDSSFFSVITDTSVAIWSNADLSEAFASEDSDMMQRLKPTHEIPTAQRLLCSSVTIITEQEKKTIVKKTKVNKKAAKD